MLLFHASAAFLVATAIAWIELVTSKYPRTIRLFWARSWALWAYAIVYGVISFGFTWAYGSLTAAGILQMGGSANVAGANTPSLVTAIMIGLSAKALLHIRLFAVPATGTQQTFPVGTETIVQLFEPWLLRTVGIDEFNSVSIYLQAKAKKYVDLKAVKAQIKENMPGPSSLPLPERTALEHDVDQTKTVRGALEIYLREFGVSTVDQHFPD